MKYLFDQLQRDANKQGAWEAKLALALYFIKKNTEFPIKNALNTDELTRANKYLDEVIKQGHENPYFQDAWNAKYKLAELFLQKSNNTEGSVILDEIINAGEKMPDNIPCFLDAKIKRELLKEVSSQNVILLRAANNLKSRVNNSRGTQQVLYVEQNELKYKTIRAMYDMNSSTYSPHKYRQDLFNLVSQPLYLTDTLRAKVIFQLIRVNLEIVSQIEARDFHQTYFYLKEAITYCHMLTDDSALKDMKKAKDASRLLDIINDNLRKGRSTSFSSHMASSFKMGQDISRFSCKGLGVVVGSIIDIIPLALLFKLMDMSDMRERGATLVESWVGSFAAGVCSKAGEYFGKYILGTIVGGLFSIGGLISYPFRWLYEDSANAVKSLKNAATLALDLPSNSSESTNKKIFDHETANHSYGNITELLPDNSEDSTKEVCSVENRPFASNVHYGTLFSSKVEHNISEKPVAHTAVDSQITSNMLP